MSDFKSCIIIGTAGTSMFITSSILYQIYKYFKSPSNVKSVVGKMKHDRDKINAYGEMQRQLELRKPKKLWNTVIFFPDLSPELPDSKLKQLVNLFNSAKISIQISMYLTTYYHLWLIITEKHREGLVIQVITDYDTYTAHLNFGPKIWKSRGIEVRLKATGKLAHHKFAIIDEEAVITGSLNWTKQGILYNNENVCVTTNPNIVSKYSEEFFDLWNYFSGSLENAEIH